MKVHKIALKPLRDLASTRLDAFSAKYPDHAEKAGQLKQSILRLLAADSADFKTTEGFFDAIIKSASELDDGYVYAASQDLIEKLGGLAREALSEGVPVLPEVTVGLSIAPKIGESSNTTGTAAGSRTRLGGKPDWIQGNESPICESCQKTMTFVAQIDSIAHQDSDLGRFLSGEGSFMFADVGMIYVFWCSKCNETKAVLQCG